MAWNTEQKVKALLPNPSLVHLRSDDNDDDDDDEAGTHSSTFFWYCTSPRQSSTPTLTIQNPNEAAAHKGGD